MKKLLLLLAAVGMIFTACETGGVDEGGNGTPTQSNKIATIEEQSANITATIATLQTTKSAVEATIASLKASEESATRGNDNDNNGVKTMIAALEERVEALEQMIANLTGYTQGDLTEMQDWATATFATMEQYNALAAELATLKALIEGFEGVSTTELSEALAASEESMKQWVNEQLSGYATIAEVEAQIAALTASLTEELKSEVEKVVATLTALMSNTKQEYEKAIAEAIQNQGIINEQIAKDIADINKRIDEELATINKRLDDIEKRLDEIEETIKDLVNRIQSVSYIKKYGDEATPVVTSAEGATVTLEFEVLPKETIEPLALYWKNYTKVKALYSETTDFVDMPITSFLADTEKGIITVVASGENLSQEFYAGQISASLRLEIHDGNNDRCSEYIPITPQRWLAEGIDLIPANNEIYYVTTDGNTLEPNAESDFGAKLVSNTYDYNNGCFVLKFDNDISQIGDHAFSEYTSLRNVAIPDSVTSIGNYAFYRCTSLTGITIPDSVTSIGNYAFYYCSSLTSVTIPDSVTSIGEHAFRYCTSLTSITIPDSVTSIGEHTFQYCTSLTSITIPDSVTSIESYAFSYCTSLTSVTIPDSVTSIGYCAFNLCQGELIINSKIVETDYTVDTAPNKDTHWLYNSKFTKITLEEGVTRIGNYAFYNCTSLTSVTIPDSVTSIGNYAFYRCTSLTGITIPDSVPSIGNYAFYSCISLTSITIPDSVTEIGDYAFRNCTSLTSVTIPDSVTSIGKFAFRDCSSLTSVTIPNSVTTIDSSAFYACTSLTSITIPESVTTIGGHAFDDCSSLTSVTIPNSVTSIGDSPFSGCTGELIVNCDIPNGNSKTGVFNGALFTKVTIGDSVSLVGNYAFYNCTSLTNITIGNSVTSIGNYAFYNCTSLTSINIPDSITSIGGNVFYDCTSLTSITIPDSVTSIGSHAFSGCKGELIINSKIVETNYTSSSSTWFDDIKFSKITIGNNVSKIGNYVFSYCSSIKYIAITDSVTKIGSHAFAECNKLTSITIPDSVTSIGDSAFYNCTSLAAFYGKFASSDNKCLIIDGVLRLFAIACGATEYIIPDGIIKIQNYAFRNCTSLTSVTIPDSVTSIGKAFYNCKSLKEVYCKPIVPPVGNRDMFSCYDSNRGTYLIGCNIYVPTASVEAYKSASCWNDYSDYIVGYDF